MISIKSWEFSDFICHYLPHQSPRHGIEATVLHHTYRPDAGDYEGLSTIKGIQSYHRNRRGWRDIGANAYVGPDRAVYNARPLSFSNYAHAYISRGWEEVPAGLRKLAAPDRNFLNRHAFGVEVIGDYDVQPATPAPPALDTALDLLAAVHRLYRLAPERLFLHRDAAYKSCPGNNIGRSWARRELRKRMQTTPEISVQLLPGSTPVDCRPRVVDGVTRCDLRPLAGALGYVVIADSLQETGMIYLRKRSH